MSRQRRKRRKGGLVSAGGLAIALLLTSGGARGEEVDIGAALPLTPELSSPAGQFHPSVACDANGSCLVVWEQGASIADGGINQIYGARVGLSQGRLTVLDPAGSVLAPSACSQQRPRVAFGAGGYLVVWQELSAERGHDISAARVSATDDPLQAARLSLSAGLHNEITPDVAFDAAHEQFYVVWADFRSESNFQIFGARLDANGALLDSEGLALTDGAGSAPHTPVIGSNDTGLLVAWSERGMSTYSSTIRGTLLGPEGTPAAPAFPDKLTFRVGAKDSVGKAFPHGNLVASGDRFALFTVSGYGHGGTYSSAIMFRFGPDGAAINPEYPLDLDPYEMAFNIQGVPVASGFLAVWEGIASEERAAFHSSPAHGIFAARVDPTLEQAVDFEAPLVVADSDAGEYNPTAAAMAGTYVLVVYEEDNLEDGQAGQHLLKAKLLTLGDGGWVEPDAGPSLDAGNTAALDGGTRPSTATGCSCRLALGARRAASGSLILALLCAMAIVLLRRGHR